MRSLVGACHVKKGPAWQTQLGSLYIPPILVIDAKPEEKP